MSARVCATVPPGRYDLLLDLPAPERRLRSRDLLPGGETSYNSAYAIQLANNGVWEPQTGYNDLGHTLTVGAHQPKTDSCHGALVPRPLH